MDRGIAAFKIPLCCWAHVFRDVLRPKPRSSRSFVTITHRRPPRVNLPPKLPEHFYSQLPNRLRPDRAKKRITIYPPPQPIKKLCPDPVRTIQESQIHLLDPSSARTALFSRDNPEAAKPGDILHVTFRNGEPFSGVFLAHRNRGQDSSILLRNHLTRVGTEMQVKVYSPNVTGIEVAERAEKKPRRKRLYYMRLPKHDRGDINGIVLRYLRAKQNLASGSGAQGIKGAAVGGRRTTSGKKGKKR